MVAVPGGDSRNAFNRMRETALQMSAAAGAILDSLDPPRRSACTFDVDDEDRLHWDYRPARRASLAIAQMDSAQQLRGLALVASGLSREGNITALNVMSLEKILGAVEGSRGRHRRDPGSSSPSSARRVSVLPGDGGSKGTTGR